MTAPTPRRKKREKTDAEKSADRLRRQQVKKRAERWEDMLAEGIKLLKARHSIRKLDPPTRVVYSKGAAIPVRVDAGGCDFEGGYRGIATAIEAKDTSDDVLYLGVIKDHQRDRLELTHLQNGIALVAVRLGHEHSFRAFALPWAAVNAMIQVGKASVSTAELEAGDVTAYAIRCGVSCGKMVALLDNVMEEALFSVASYARAMAGRG